jgi:hypothetical protein
MKRGRVGRKKGASKRNRLAGTKRGKSKSARRLQRCKKCREKKKKYDTKYHKSRKRRKYRALLQRINRKKGTHGNLDGKDVAHQSRTRTKMQRQSKNRADKKNNHFA